ncbi:MULTISPECIES: DUF2550 domain-containing protein [Pseudonocardia]|uniref:DUF2550 domain-containing protein n=1 Tax=Pseudonocardia oroxyli TaxID=366584 RepID=A0A1G7N6L4_PSEOR|nr:MULTISPECIES: DUF2550 domain-containing protein [Pseudonocardia]MCF7550371.1 DUF2550 domain-containing protein [Pseudonocardia sp. WMMC193]SDF69683.1 Protein of unknown function [Pseudonocardia oroxyli]
MAETVAIIVGVVLVLVCLALGWLAVRRVRLMRGGGVDLCLRRRFAVTDWHFGVGRYRGDEFAWYRLTSFRVGPTVAIDRNDLEIVDRRAPLPGESFAIPYATSVIRCRDDAHEVELAMSADVLTGFLSWLEAAPPGYRQAS